MNDDLISRKALMDTLQIKDDCEKCEYSLYAFCKRGSDFVTACEAICDAPSVEPTLYGYDIKHLAYIARVMQKEGVSAEQAVQTFGDMSRAIKMLIDEAQEKVEEVLRGERRAGDDL